MREIIVDSGDDPWVTQHQDAYYYCRNNPEYSQILIAKANDISNIGKVALIPVWTGRLEQESSKEIWAPELHLLDGKWYIYFAASDGLNENHRMFVLESLTDDPQGEYELKGKITTEDDHWAIDGTVLELPNSSRYFIWSGWEGDENGCQNLYIASMETPWSVKDDRVCISQPTYDWEKYGMPINEGPQVLSRDGKLFIIYSASGSWTDEYCLGQLSLKGENPLEASAWEKNSEPVFSKTNEIHAPGHASFVKDRDGVYWIIYHSARHSGSGWDRQVRAKPFEWNANGTPNFGKPE